MTIDLLEEYQFEYELFIANQEAYEQLFQLECGFVNESMGFISLNESIIDTISKWFSKIVEAIQNVVSKLENKLSDLFDQQLSKYAKIMNNQEKTDPVTLQIPITNYHEYDFTKFRDGSFDVSKSFNNPEFLNTVASIAGGGDGSKSEKTDKNSIGKAVYPDLYDDNVSVFDKMKDLVTVGKDTDQQTMLNMEMLDNSWKYVSEEYKPLIQKIKQDKDAITSQKKNVDAVAQQISNMIQSNNEPTPKKESFVFCEEYLLEAPQDQNNPVKDQKIEQGENGANKEVYAKILMAYIQVATDILSAKAKVINTAFMDKFRIITYYCKRIK